MQGTRWPQLQSRAKKLLARPPRTRYRSAMRKTGKCPKCDGTNILANVMALEKYDAYHGDTQLVVEGDPGAMLFKDAAYSPVRAWVCAVCGYTEWYTLDPKELLFATQRAAGRK